MGSVSSFLWPWPAQEKQDLDVTAMVTIVTMLLRSVATLVETIFVLQLGKTATDSNLRTLTKQWARYTGSGVHSAQDCARVCFQGGYNTYSYWPTFGICCCDCGTTPCF